MGKAYSLGLFGDRGESVMVGIGRWDELSSSEGFPLAILLFLGFQVWSLIIFGYSVFGGLKYFYTVFLTTWDYWWIRVIDQTK